MNPRYSKLPSRPCLVSGEVFAIALIAVFAVSAPASFAQESVVLNDQFADGSLAHTEVADAAWYYRSLPTTLAVTDATLDYRPFSTASSTRVIIGVMPGTATLGSNVGDSLTMSFTLSITDTKNGSTNLIGATDAFAFGLYNSGGETITGNNFTNDVNHAGYLVRFGLGSSFPGLSIYRENGGNSRPMFGTDLVALSGSEALTPSSVAGTTSNAEASLTLERLANGEVSLTFSMDGTSWGSVMDSGGGVVSSFDEVTFNVFNGWAVRLDDINVSTVSSIPEPNTVAMLLGSGVLVSAVVRRRREHR